MVLLWLVPPVVVTVAAMVWVAWLGREGRGEVDRDEALRRMTSVLDPDARGGRARRARRRLRRVSRLEQLAPATRRRERSTGVVVRRSRVTTTQPRRVVGAVADDGSAERRRAS